MWIPTNLQMRDVYKRQVQLIIKGAVIVAMIIFDSVYNKYMEEKLVRRKALEEERKAAV